MDLAIVLLILLIVVAVVALKFNDPGLAFPFRKKTNLFTPVERNFLNLLDVAVGNQYRIICRVKLADVITIRQGTDKKTSRNALIRAGAKQLDFVLCDKNDLSPVVAIDLVHPNGKEGYKSQRDWFVSSSLEAAKIPHIRIKVKSGYKPLEIRQCIEGKLASLRYNTPKEPIIKGTLGQAPDNKTGIRRPVAA
ncbi:DUF2726 domain-containing protein [Neptunicella marina]|uniref:DUF2726 domain-containing protein n=1 Tax=Neptunicella marina TaxID=2125989 RepID=A0A8J6ITB3_9ALTE|nr:DUF2726 domain-containing protein [Neptunicella marina]MBC3765191.1 DUF2726 domain-containing protein [Neptunicella marina]